MGVLQFASFGFLTGFRFTVMDCARYNDGTCRSCQWLEKEYPQQLEDKQQHLNELLADHPIRQWLPAFPSPHSAFRNKAKMVVSGSVERPLLGVLHRDGTPVDLCDCPLYPDSFQPVFTVLKTFIARAGLTPYQVARRRGGLKYLLLTESRSNGHFMLRFVLRSETKLNQLRAALPWLQEQLPQLAVISANIQPVHQAIMEGEQEIPLSRQQVLEETFNQIPLAIRPQSFFQTNPDVAASLYDTARRWVQALPVRSLWDLFCGVGGFGLHCATPEMTLTGIEISAEAIACARRSAEQLGLNKVHFDALDSTRFATGEGAVPDLVIVNPPRRGIGDDLCQYLSRMAPLYILYSSCNAQSMAKDMSRLAGYRVEQIQLFDMFPHTAHYEVLTLLKRVA